MNDFSNLLWYTVTVSISLRPTGRKRYSSTECRTFNVLAKDYRDLVAGLYDVYENDDSIDGWALADYRCLGSWDDYQRIHGHDGESDRACS